MNNSDIQIVEKPDWLTWEDIKQCLFEAHSLNRAKGINMAHYQWSTDKLVASIGENGKMFVALDGEKLVGVAAICEKDGNSWYAKGKYAYLGLAGVLPEYTGCGIYSKMVRIRETYARQNGYNVVTFDTHQKNDVVQKIALKNGYRYVRYFRAASGDHYSVVMAKWINGSPYSGLYCFYKFQVSKIKTLLRTKIFSH